MARNALTRTSILSDISSYKKAGKTSSIHQIQQLGHVKAVKTAIHVLKSQHAADVRKNGREELLLTLLEQASQ